MNTLLSLAAGVAAAIASAFTILYFGLAQSPPALFGVLLLACCIPAVIGALGQRSTAPGGQADSPNQEPDREEGEVKWFNVSKGFGFIRRGSGEEIFVHYRSIREPGRSRRALKDGQRVSFRVAESDKGPQAEDVEPVG